MSYEDPMQEATDPATAPERLEELARHENVEVKQAVWRNPSLPEDVWREALLKGWPEAWANPMAPFYLLAWTPRETDGEGPARAARSATYPLWENPERCSPEGKVLIASKVQEWWITSESGSSMMDYLSWWGMSDGTKSAKHREVVRILVLCLRTDPNLTAKDRQALDLLEAWSAGGEDARSQVHNQINSSAVRKAADFSLNCYISASQGLSDLMVSVSSNKRGAERDNAIDAHNRVLADVIRRARPLPPVVA
jgi:hypothetical protein